MTSTVKMSSVEVSQPKVSPGEMSSSNMFVIGSWDEPEFGDSLESLSLSDSPEDLSDVEDSSVKSPSLSFDYGQNSTVSFKSGPMYASSFKSRPMYASSFKPGFFKSRPMHASTPKSSPVSVRSPKPEQVSTPSSIDSSCDKYSSFSEMKRDLTDREIYKEFRSMSRKTYMNSDESLYGSSPPGIKSSLMFQKPSCDVPRNTSFPESLCSVVSTTSAACDSGFDSDTSCLNEPIQFPTKSESVFVPSSDRFLCESDSSSKEYETFQEMTEKLSDVEIHQEFLKLSRKSWHHDSGILASSPK